MNKHIYLLLGLLAGATAAAQPKGDKQYRGMAMIIDLAAEANPSLISNRAVECELACHLMATEACILTTTQVLQNLTKFAADHAAGHIDPAIGIWEKAYRGLQDFNIYSNGQFVLFIPTKHASAYRPEFNLAAAQMKPINPPTFAPEPHLIMRLAQNYVEVVTHPFKIARGSDQLLRLLKQLFVKQENSLWNLYLFGHGNAQGTTVGLTEDAFRELLQFAGSDINTHMLMYTSCYGGGKMNEYIFADNARYPYTIVCTGLSDTTIGKRTPPRQQTADINTFFGARNNLNTAKQVAQALSVQCICQNDDPCSCGSLDMSLQIRMPNSTSFVLTTYNSPARKTFIINDKTAPSRLLGHDAQNIILNTSYVSHPLRLHPRCEIRTALKGDTWHYIEHIIASDIEMQDFFKISMGYNDQVQKVFLVKKVTLKDGQLDNLMIFHNSPIPSLILPHPFKAFWLQGGISFRVPHLGAPPKQLDPEIASAYLTQFDYMHDRIRQGKQPIRPADRSKLLRKLLLFKPVTWIGHLGAGAFAAWHMRQALNDALKSHAPFWIREPLSLAGGLASGTSALLATTLCETLLDTQLRYFDLNK